MDDDNRYNGIWNAATALNDLRGFEVPQHLELNALLEQVIPSVLNSEGRTFNSLEGGSVFSDTCFVRAAFSNVVGNFSKELEESSEDN